ncbi:MAG: hypothetical protein PHC46_04300 [Clostridia bacterium]|nr:hypothetical protein [Clostridia bacterium]
MKKIVLILFVSILCTTVYGEKVVGKYYLSYFNQSYDIEASEIKDGKFTLYIQVHGGSQSTKAMLFVESDELKEFTQSLLQMKTKFEEWSKVAKENNVTEMSKKMDINFPPTSICWFFTEWYFSFYHTLIPAFMILKDGTYAVSIVEEATSSSNEYIDETIYWVFSDPKEIDDLISQLDAEKIKSKLEADDNASDLFK